MKNILSFSKIIGIGVCILSIIIMCGLFFFSSDHRAQKKICEKYYISVQTEKYEDAYNCFSDSYKENYSADKFKNQISSEFKGFIKQYGDNVKIKSKIKSSVKSGDTSKITVVVKFYGDKGSGSSEIQMEMIKQNGKWLINKL